MRLARMGAFFPTRLSFMRTLIRRLIAEGATVARPVWEIDGDGYGRAVYTVPYGGHTYSLVAFSTPLADADRTDRVIAEAWDTSYVLFDGIPDVADLARLEANAPLQEAGRFEARDLVLSRANKSVRLFAHVVDRLSGGHQPDLDLVGRTGYLMRTTAVYGNGKFGIADRARIADRPWLGEAFQAEMLTVWLIRGFTLDLVEHIARSRSPRTAVPLSRPIKHHLGIGNATGLGMAPFLVSHPILINNWMRARETALARVRALEHAPPEKIAQIRALAERAARHLQQWNVADERQAARIERLRSEFAAVRQHLDAQSLSGPLPWDGLVRWSGQFSLECQEIVVALVLEPHGELVDDLTTDMESNALPLLDPAMSLAALHRIITENFAWALAIDFAQPGADDRFWYVSEEKLEPRLGSRHQEPGAELEQPLDIARRVQAMAQDLNVFQTSEGDVSVARFLLRNPEHRYIVRRVQALPSHPYGEIRDNLIADTCLPIDMLRCKLSFFGAAKFDPKSELWTRITMYQGAPLFDELASPASDDWWLPVLEVGAID